MDETETVLLHGSRESQQCGYGAAGFPGILHSDDPGANTNAAQLYNKTIILLSFYDVIF